MYEKTIDLHITKVQNGLNLQNFVNLKVSKYKRVKKFNSKYTFFCCYKLIKFDSRHVSPYRGIFEQLFFLYFFNILKLFNKQNVAKLTGSAECQRENGLNFKIFFTLAILYRQALHIKLSYFVFRCFR